jgi:hypothetical protein
LEIILGQDLLTNCFMIVKSRPSCMIFRSESQPTILHGESKGKDARLLAKVRRLFSHREGR